MKLAMFRETGPEMFQLHARDDDKCHEAFQELFHETFHMA